jgi:hypothetical protein
VAIAHFAAILCQDGWGSTSEDYVQMAHGEQQIDCHTKVGPQCAGAAIYRANVLKMPRDNSVIQLPMDTDTVFKTPMEFIAHHHGKASGK